MPTTVLYSTEFHGLSLWRRGKVRDVYAVGDNLLIVATDRISAFDVVMADPIPGKGALLTAMTLWWFDKLSDVFPNHIVSADVDAYPEECRPYADVLRGRSMLVKKTDPLPIECVARGYLAGSGWKEYRQSGVVCGNKLPANLVQSDKLPNTIFTPATKAEYGHDENITFEQAASLVGKDVADVVSKATIQLYEKASAIALKHGLIIADTKFEFGRDATGQLILIDEVLTPDSSRYWSAASYKPGVEQENYDKQFLRDYLESINWDKNPPPPLLPKAVIEATGDKYREALMLLTGSSL